MNFFPSLNKLVHFKIIITTSRASPQQILLCCDVVFCGLFGRSSRLGRIKKEKQEQQTQGGKTRRTRSLIKFHFPPWWAQVKHSKVESEREKRRSHHTHWTNLSQRMPSETLSLRAEALKHRENYDALFLVDYASIKRRKLKLINWIFASFSNSDNASRKAQTFYVQFLILLLLKLKRRTVIFIKGRFSPLSLSLTLAETKQWDL